MILRHVLSQFTKFVLADLKYFVGYHSNYDVRLHCLCLVLHITVIFSCLVSSRLKYVRSNRDKIYIKAVVTRRVSDVQFVLPLVNPFLSLSRKPYCNPNTDPTCIEYNSCSRRIVTVLYVSLMLRSIEHVNS